MGAEETGSSNLGISHSALKYKVILRMEKWLVYIYLVKTNESGNWCWVCSFCQITMITLGRYVKVLNIQWSVGVTQHLRLWFRFTQGCQNCECKLIGWKLLLLWGLQWPVEQGLLWGDKVPSLFIGDSWLPVMFSHVIRWMPGVWLLERLGWGLHHSFPTGHFFSVDGRFSANWYFDV